MNDEFKYSLAATISASLICAFGFLGNLVTILTLIRYPKLMAKTTTAFVLSLCISDLIFCSVSLPLITSRYLYEKWILATICSKLFPVLFHGNVILYMLSLMAVTVNRFMFNFCRYTFISYCKVSIYLQLVVIWSTSFLVALPPLLEMWGRLGLDESTSSCTILKRLDGESLKKHLFFFGFVFLCLVVMIFYSVIYLNVKSSNGNLQSHQVHRSPSENSRMERENCKLIKLMLQIFVCFVFCFLPLMCVHFLDDKVRFPTLHVLTSLLAWASSVINPCIYAASNRQYRSAYQKLFPVFRRGVPTRNPEQLPNSQESSGTDNEHDYESVVDVAAN